MPKLTRLRAVRESRALTQAELAERSGVAQPTLSRLENGDAAARASTHRKLAKALRVRLTDLYDVEVPA
jgi:transcriptional regulator with XRE-family HTH domain